MDDLRFRWLKDSIYTILNIDEVDPAFEDFLEGDDGANELLIAKFLNESDTNVDDENALLFYKEVFEELREEQVEITEEEWIEEQLAINPDFDPNEEGTTTNSGADEQQQSGVNDSSANQTVRSGVQNGTSDNIDQTGEGTNVDGENQTPETRPKPKRYRNELVKYLRTMLYLCRDIYPSNLSKKNCIYFLRTIPGTIPAPSSIEDADKIMIKYLDYGLLNGHTLHLLANTLNKIYNPLLTYQSEHEEANAVDGRRSAASKGSQKEIAPTEPSTEETEEDKKDEKRRQHELELRAMLRDEFLIQLQKFLNQIGLTLRQLEGEVRLELPPQFDISKIVKTNKDAIEQAESLVYKWNGEIREALERELKKTPQTPGPLGEIDWWRERNISLSSLFEQTKQEHVEQVLEKLELAENAAPSSFRDTRTDLSKYYLEAKDNVKFLSTLERHFKNVTHGATFRVVTETIPKMMSALRMVWIISRHYNRDERMVPLMERIANQLCERVARSINVRTLFSHQPSEIIEKCTEAKDMLERWKQSYFDVRAEIEQSGRDSRWEFDNKRLFKLTDHMAIICNDFIAIAKELEQFYNIFTPELKSVTGKPHKINEILERVHKVLELIEHAPCDPFRLEDLDKWKMVSANYGQQIEEIDEQTKSFISESFKSLRSAESAFDMLLKFEKNNTRMTIQDEMHKRFNDILRQYDNEITEINSIFQHNKTNPPVNKNQPPYSGAIAWSRSLFRRIKHTMLRLHTKEALMQTELGKQIKSYYLRVAREMKAYEDGKFNEWKQRTEQILPSLQKRNVLKELPPGENDNPLTPRYTIDFDPQLNEMMTEARYLEQFDYILPETIRHLALSEEKMKLLSTQLKIVLKNYHRLIDSLEPHEQSLLEENLRQLKRHMQTGTQRLPWTSTNHEKFITVISELISKLDSTINQIKKNAQDIHVFLDEIRQCNLFREPPPNPDGSLVHCKEYFEIVESRRRHDAIELQKKYKLIGPLIAKVEGLVFNTNTSQSPKMKAYYAYWERQIFSALSDLVIENLKSLRDTLANGSKPLFQVDALLVVPAVAMQPNQNEIIKLFSQSMRDCVEVSNGRIHQANIIKVNHSAKTVTVEWEEKTEGKGKEVDLDAIIELNPNLFTSITNASSYNDAINNNTRHDHHVNDNMTINLNRRTRQDRENLRKQPQPNSFSRPGGISNTQTLHYNNDLSPNRQQNLSTSITNDTNKSKVVKEIERIAANREQRRVRQEQRRQKLSEVDHSIPAWEFQAMITEYRQQLDIKSLTINDPQKDLKICVCVRKRPITKKELNKKDIDVLTIPNKDHVIVHLPKVKVDLTKYIDNQKFRFDYTFREICNNELVYHFTAKPLVQLLFQGHNPMVFAYGQTGSGKTYTMGGDLSQRDVDFSKGIYALTANDIFLNLNKPSNKGQYDVYCTFFEIYCTKVFDLFNDKKRLRVLEDHKNLVQVVGRKEEQVQTVNEVMSLIRRGMSVRTSGTTSANEHSSRSHAIFQISLKKKNINKEYGKISLIDLAGSERGRDTQTNDKTTLMEGAQINKSLLTLKECIRSLGRNAEHIPFRGSTLTKVLRDSFIGEKSKVCMIAMISPGSSDVEHTLNTLRYADRVKELNVDELIQRGVEIHQKQILNEPYDLQLSQDDDDDDDDDERFNESLSQPLASSRSNVRKPQQQQQTNSNKRPLENQHLKRKFEQAIARSHEIEDVTLETHHQLMDDLPQIVSNHQLLLDASTKMNYDREDYAKQLLHLIEKQQQYLTKLRTKALQMRDAVAYEDSCAKVLSLK